MNSITNNYLKLLNDDSIDKIISKNLDILNYLFDKRYIKIDCDYKIETNANTINELVNELDNNITKPKIKLVLYNNVKDHNNSTKYNDCIKIQDKKTKRRKINHQDNELIIHQKYLNKIHQYYFINHYLIQDKYNKIILLNKIKISINNDEIFNLILSYL